MAGIHTYTSLTIKKEEKMWANAYAEEMLKTLFMENHWLLFSLYKTIWGGVSNQIICQKYMIHICMIYQYKYSLHRTVWENTYIYFFTLLSLKDEDKQKRNYQYTWHKSLKEQIYIEPELKRTYKIKPRRIEVIPTNRLTFVLTLKVKVLAFTDRQGQSQVVDTHWIFIFDYFCKVKIRD